jgi:hypothetical protein
MSTNYTPGPWEINGPNLIQDTHGQFAAAIASYRGGERITDNEMLANARLIAAAPDLYEALRAVVVQANQGKIFERDSCIAQARSAIAKTTAG